MANYRALAAAAAKRYGIDPNIFLRQIGQESGFNPRARSGAGAEGIAQIVPKWHPGVDPYNPGQALDYAARMDASNLRKYGNWRDVLSVYNSGRPFSQGRGISETRNYVSSILGGRSPGGSPGVAQALPAASSPMQAPAGSNNTGLRAALAQNLIAASQATASGKTPNYSQTFQLVSALRGSTPTRAERSAIASSTITPGRRGGLRELFYDPLGAVKNDKPIPAIGGHRDHVHIATANVQEMIAAINTARHMGLSVSENPYVGRVHPVHVHDSNHYRVLGRYQGKLVGGAADVSGPANRMADFFKWAERTF